MDDVKRRFRGHAPDRGGIRPPVVLVVLAVAALLGAGTGAGWRALSGTAQTSAGTPDSTPSRPEERGILRDGSHDDRPIPTITAPPPTTRFTSTLVAQHSGRCLDVPNGDDADGVRLQQWDCGPGNPNQLFRLEAVDERMYLVINEATGKCLDVQAASAGDGVPVVQWSCHGGPNQQFTLERVEGGERTDFLLVAGHSGKCLDVSGISPDNGALMNQWTCHDDPQALKNQIWRLAGYPLSV